TPTVTVDLPSPAGVGLIPVTSTRRPLGLRRASAESRTLALYFPYSSSSSSSSPSSAAMSATGRSLAAWAMAMSVGTVAVVVTDRPVLEGDHSGERKVRRDLHSRCEHLRARAERMQHDGGSRPPQHRGHVVVRLAGVDHHRFAGLGRERQLRLEGAALVVAG